MLFRRIDYIRYLRFYCIYVGNRIDVMNFKIRCVVLFPMNKKDRKHKGAINKPTQKPRDKKHKTNNKQRKKLQTTHDGLFLKCITENVIKI